MSNVKLGRSGLRSSWLEVVQEEIGRIEMCEANNFYYSGRTIIKQNQYICKLYYNIYTCSKIYIYIQLIQQS